MQCDRASVALVDYLYRELPGPQQKQLQAHLDGCRSCAAELAQMQAVIGWLDRAAAREPKGLGRNAAATVPVPLLVRQMADWRRAAGRWRATAAGLGALAAAVLLAFALVSDIRWRQGTLVVQFAWSAPRVPENSSPEARDPATRLQTAEARLVDLERHLRSIEQGTVQLVREQEQLLSAWQRAVPDVRVRGVAQPIPAGSSELDLVLTDFNE